MDYQKFNDKVIEAGGFFDALKRHTYNALYSIVNKSGMTKIADKILPNARDDYPPMVRHFLAEYGNEVITSMKIERTPVNALLTGTINQISGNELDRLMKKYGFDKLFHLGVVITFTDRYYKNRVVKIEKNEVINIVEWNFNKNSQYLDVDLKNQRITILNLLNKTRQLMGKDFFLYDATIDKNDCQGFIFSMLKSNNLINNENSDFIYQDTKELMKELPTATRQTIKGVTNLGARVNRLVYGKGFKK